MGTATSLVAVALEGKLTQKKEVRAMSVTIINEDGQVKIPAGCVLEVVRLGAVS